MLKLEDLQKIIEVALFSGCILHERPLSLLIVAAIGSGKTDLIAHYPETSAEGIYYATDVTAFALHKKHARELKDGRIRHIIIPDLLMPLNKQREQADHFITFMNGLIEEGIAKIESRDSSFSTMVPVRCGLITTIAKRDLDARKDRWAAIGFLSRMLPLSYSYDQETVDLIFQYIMKGGYHRDSPARLKIPKEADIALPENIAKQLKPLAEVLKDPEDLYAFRRLKHLIVFVKAHALYCGRLSVTTDDFGELARLSVYMNRDCTKRI